MVARLVPRYPWSVLLVLKHRWRLMIAVIADGVSRSLAPAVAAA
jgi:hypothetical protein